MTSYQRFVLVGPTGAGKSTVGPLLATRLGLRFVDLDQTLEQAAGRRITDIFEQDGEAAFRALESEMLVRCLEEDGIVLATGAGAVLDAGNRERMRAAGCVVHLHAGVRRQLERLRDRGDRPLLALVDREATLEAMARDRGAHYAAVAHLRLDTDARTAHEVVEALFRALPLASASGGARHRLDVHSPSGPYPIHIGAGLVADGLLDGRAAVGGRVLLTRRGRLLADAVVRDLTD